MTSKEKTNHPHNNNEALSEEDPASLPATSDDNKDDNNDKAHSSEGIVRMEYEYNLEDQDGRRPLFFSYIPRLLRFDNAPIEATGCATDMFARATVFLASIFLGPALLELASIQAQQSCPADDNGDADDNCLENVRVYGFKPSSLLTNIAIVAGLVSTVILPLFGAIVDHTPYRRSVGAWSAVGLVVIKIIELSLSQNTWFAVAWLQIASSIMFQLHVVAVYAYSAELSNTPSQQSHFQTHFFFVMYVSMGWYMLEVLIPGHLLGMSDVGTARWAILVTILTSIPLFSIGWKYLFRDCPPLSQVPPGQSLWTVGFYKLYKTYGVISTDLPAVGSFLQGVMFSEAADSALATIATTYMSEFLLMSSLEIGLVILIVLIGGMPGTWLGHVCCERYNPVVSAQICLILYMIVTAVAGATLTPQNKNIAYLFGSLWGVCQGWMHPQHTTIFVTITPHTMEWMGVFLFACQILNFLPPLIFTILNEAGWSMQWGMASLILYFAMGFLGLMRMGDYSKATERVRPGADGNTNHDSDHHDHHIILNNHEAIA